MNLLSLGTKVTSTWSPHVTGPIVGYGYLFMNGEMRAVYLIDIGVPSGSYPETRGRMFDVNREGPGPVSARILTVATDMIVGSEGEL